MNKAHLNNKIQGIDIVVGKQNVLSTSVRSMERKILHL